MVALLAFFGVARCAPGGGLGYGGVVGGKGAQKAYDKRYGSGFIKELGEKLSDIRGRVGSNSQM